MKYYLVAYDGNYADEFDVYFHAVMSEEEWKDAKRIIGKTEWIQREFWFGTNENIDVNTAELMECLNNSKELTEEQFKVLQELELTHISFGDGLNWDHIIDEAYNWVYE